MCACKKNDKYQVWPKFYQTDLSLCCQLGFSGQSADSQGEYSLFLFLLAKVNILAKGVLVPGLVGGGVAGF